MCVARRRGARLLPTILFATQNLEWEENRREGESGYAAPLRLVLRLLGVLSRAASEFVGINELAPVRVSLQTRKCLGPEADRGKPSPYAFKGFKIFANRCGYFSGSFDYLKPFPFWTITHEYPDANLAGHGP